MKLKACLSSAGRKLTRADGPAVEVDAGSPAHACRVAGADFVHGRAHRRALGADGAVLVGRLHGLVGHLLSRGRVADGDHLAPDLHVGAGGHLEGGQVGLVDLQQGHVAFPQGPGVDDLSRGGVTRTSCRPGPSLSARRHAAPGASRGCGPPASTGSTQPVCGGGLLRPDRAFPDAVQDHPSGEEPHGPVHASSTQWPAVAMWPSGLTANPEQAGVTFSPAWPAPGAPGGRPLPGCAGWPPPRANPASSDRSRG